MKATCALASIAVLAATAATSAPPATAIRLSATDQAAAFRAAGFKRVGRQWRACEDVQSLSYSPGTIETVRDINGDGLPDAVITEGGTDCFGMTGTGFTLVSKQANGRWIMLAGGAGIPTFQPRRAATGWPDIEVGGPGFCFPVERWNGRAYALHRFQYDGKPCRPPANR